MIGASSLCHCEEARRGNHWPIVGGFLNLFATVVGVSENSLHEFAVAKSYLTSLLAMTESRSKS
jgi:hypothetical protein